MLSVSRLGLGIARQPALFSKSIIRPLSTSSKKLALFKTIPQPPGHIVGNVNDAYVPPPPSRAHGSLHWTSERIVTIGMTPLMLTPFITGSAYPVADAIMGTLLLYHCYAGFQSCIIDYIPLRVYGSIHNVAMGLLTLGTLIAGYGIYEIEKSEKEGFVGLTKKIWNA